MTKQLDTIHALRRSIELPCGAVLKNRIAKSPMSDSLANGKGDPTKAQIRLYERWAEGGAALSMIGEVQGDSRFPERPGNIVLSADTDQAMLSALVKRASINNAHLWPQLGHAGALSYSPISQAKGPSALDVSGIQCAELTLKEILDLPSMYARAALLAKKAGFSGVHIHAGHGFLLSQFLSPLFNHRTDQYGGSIEARSQIVLDIINEVRNAVGLNFPIGIRINSTDNLDGDLTESDALKLVTFLDKTSIDLIDISGGTYFPGAKSSSDRSSSGAYFIDFAQHAKNITSVPLMVTGGFKKRDQAIEAITSGAIDIVGIARAMVLNPCLAKTWLSKQGGDPEFPRFKPNPPGGVTAWFTMRLTALGEDREDNFEMDLSTAIQTYEERDAKRCIAWQEKFSSLY